MKKTKQGELIILRNKFRKFSDRKNNNEILEYVEIFTFIIAFVNI